MKYVDAIEQAIDGLKTDVGQESIAIHAAVRLAIHAAFAIDPTESDADDWGLFATALMSVCDTLQLYDIPLLISIDEALLQDTPATRRDTIRLIKATADRLHNDSFDTTASTDRRWQTEIAAVNLEKATVLLAGPT